MSWTYSGNPSYSKLDECRFIIGDTNVKEPIMQDEEIQYLIASFPTDDNALMYHLFSQTATRFARDIKRSLGPQSEDPTSRLEYFKSKALEYKDKMSSAGLPKANAAYPKIFRKGMHTNTPYPVPNGGDYLVR